MFLVMVACSVVFFLLYNKFTSNHVCHTIKLWAMIIEHCLRGVTNVIIRQLMERQRIKERHVYGLH
jgi:hypothetical protein